jgi:hypothetical protein
MIVSLVFSLKPLHFNNFQIADTYDLREKALHRCVELTQHNLTEAKANATGTEIRPLQLAVSLLIFHFRSLKHDLKQLNSVL